MRDVDGGPRPSRSRPSATGPLRGRTRGRPETGRRVSTDPTADPWRRLTRRVRRLVPHVFEAATPDPRGTGPLRPCSGRSGVGPGCVCKALLSFPRSAHRARDTARTVGEILAWKAVGETRVPRTAFVLGGTYSGLLRPRTKVQDRVPAVSGGAQISDSGTASAPGPGGWSPRGRHSVTRTRQTPPTLRAVHGRPDRATCAPWFVLDDGSNALPPKSLVVWTSADTPRVRGTTHVPLLVGTEVILGDSGPPESECPPPRLTAETMSKPFRTWGRATSDTRAPVPVVQEVTATQPPARVPREGPPQCGSQDV